MKKKVIYRIVVFLILVAITTFLFFKLRPPAEADLVLYLNFDQGKDDKVADSARGVMGLVSNAKWVAGRIGGSALDFNGNSFVEIADNQSLKLDKFEVEAWIKLTRPVSTLPGSYQTIIAKEGDFILRLWHGSDGEGKGRGIAAIYFSDGAINYVNAHLAGFNYIVGNSGSEANDVSLAPGRWHKIAMSYDGQTLTLSVDDKVAAKKYVTAKPLHSDHPLYIGSHMQRDGFIGIIDDVKVRKID